MPEQTDDPEIIQRLERLGWTPGAPVPSISRLAAYGVIRRDGNVLLCRVGPGNLGEGLWTLPGGGMEFGESPEQAAVREVEEETGYIARVTGAPAIHSDSGAWPFSGGPVKYHTIRFVYSMEITGGAERVEVDGSTDAFAWCSRAQMEELPLADIVERALGLEDHGR